MPSSAVCVFADPDAYAASIRAGTVAMTVTARGSFNANLTRVDLPDLWMQRFSENLPRVADVCGLVRGRLFVTFRTMRGPSLIQRGIEINPSAIFLHGSDQEYYQRSSGDANFGTMSLPVAHIAGAAGLIAGRDLVPLRDGTSITPAPAAMARLQRLHAAAAQLADQAPEIIINPDAARGLEQTLITALADCLADREDRAGDLAQGQHAIVMRRFRRLVEDNPEQPLYIPEICAAIRVSERTLRACCQEHLGVSPKRYLMLRRLHLARRALRAATADRATVTEIVTRYGFWQLGRFAIEYRRLFGETPSATLRRQPD